MRRIGLVLIIFFGLVIPQLGDAASTITKGKIGEQDIQPWDGVNATFERDSSVSGYSLTLRRVGAEVDAAMAYGGGVNFNDATITSALTAIGKTNKVTLLLRPGTWTISQNVDWSDYTNVTFKAVPGALISHAAYTMTIPNPVAVRYQWLSGTGAITFAGRTDYVDPIIFGAAIDGATNDRAKLQLAINAASGVKAPVNWMGILQITEATTVTMPSGTSIFGFGTSNTELRSSASTRVKGILSGSDSTNGNSDITIKDMKITRTVLTGSSGSNFNEYIYIGSGPTGTGISSRINLDNVYFYSDGVEAAAGNKIFACEGCQHSNVRNCVFSADVDNAIVFANNSAVTKSYSSIENNKFLNMGDTNDSSLIILSTGNINVVGNNAYADGNFIEQGTYGLNINIIGNIYEHKSSGGGRFITSTGYEFKNYVISNNLMIGNTSSVASAMALTVGTTSGSDGITRDVFVSNNVIYGFSNCIKVYTNDATTIIRNVLLSNNSCSYAADSGIVAQLANSASATGLKIIGNQVSYVGKAGIYYIGNWGLATIENNHCWNNNTAGDGSVHSGLMIQGNNAHLLNNYGYDDGAGTQANGIELVGALTGILMEGNKFWGNTVAQIHENGGPPTYISRFGNRVSQAGASDGTATLTAGTVTVSTAEVLSSDANRIMLSRGTTGGTPGHLSVGTIVNGTSFDINSSSNTDTSTILWQIVH